MKLNGNWFKKLLLLSILIIFFTHWNFIFNGFTWLDHGDIEEKRAIFNIGELYKSLFLRFGETGYYRPAVSVFHSLNYALFNLWPVPYHLLNIVLHLLISLLSLSFLVRFFKPSPVEKLLILFIVGVHPVTWFTVGSVSNLQELLVTLFILLSFIFYSKGNFLSAVFTFLALLSKETALFWIPAIIFIWEISSRRSARKIISLAFLSNTIALVFYVLLRFNAIPEIWKTKGVDLTLSQAIGTRLANLAKLISWYFIPIAPSIADTTKIMPLTPVNFTILSSITIGLFLLFIKRGISDNWSKLVILILISLAPALNILPLPRFISTHYAYFPLIFFAVFFVFLFRSIFRLKPFLKFTLCLPVALWLLTMPINTFKAGLRLENDFVLFLPETEKEPNFAEGHFYLGSYYYNQSNLKKAEEEYNKALDIPSDVISYVDKRALFINLAGIKFSENKLSEANELLENALPGASLQLKTSIYYNQALIAARTGNTNRVVELLMPYRENYTTTEPLFLLSEALKKLNRDKEAEEILKVVSKPKLK